VGTQPKDDGARACIGGVDNRLVEAEVSRDLDENADPEERQARSAQRIALLLRLRDTHLADGNVFPSFMPTFRLCRLAR
jgi:hypothetical protein